MLFFTTNYTNYTYFTNYYRFAVREGPLRGRNFSKIKFKIFQNQAPDIRRAKLSPQ